MPLTRDLYAMLVDGDVDTLYDGTVKTTVTSVLVRSYHPEREP